MNPKTILLLAFLLLLRSGTAHSQDSLPDNRPAVTVYYFHPTERCPIDQTIEENTRRMVQAEFAANLKDGSLKLLVLNTDDPVNEKLVASYEINAQALYIVKTLDGKETRTDLTEFAFSTSQSNPVRFKARVREEINTALKP